MEHVLLRFIPSDAYQHSLSPELLKAKVCLVGEASVGKSSLVRRFVVDQFQDGYLPTLGAKVMKKEITLRVGDADLRVVLQVWDIMGEPSFRELLRDAYFHGVQGVLAVADLTRAATVRGLPAWIDAARTETSHAPVVLVANKADLDADPGAEVALRDLSGSAQSWWRTSAKTGLNVEDAFRDLAEAVVLRAVHGEKEGRPEPKGRPGDG